jgi:hypothetical protein
MVNRVKLGPSTLYFVETTKWEGPSDETTKTEILCKSRWYKLSLLKYNKKRSKKVGLRRVKIGPMKWAKLN